MGFLLIGLGGILSLVAFVCFILIIVKMFQNDDATLAIICLVTILCGGLGYLIAFVMGWINAGKYGASQLMLIWTGAFVGSFIFSLIGQLLAGGDLVAPPQ